MKACTNCQYWNATDVLVTSGFDETPRTQAGYCEHNRRPRGLTLSDYTCYDYTLNPDQPVDP